MRGTSPPPKRARISPPPSAPRSTTQAQSAQSSQSTESRNGSKGKSRQDAIEIDDNEENVGTDPMRGLSEDEIFARVSRPENIPGLENWGIPPAVDPDLCSPQLKVRLYHPFQFCGFTVHCQFSSSSVQESIDSSPGENCPVSQPQKNPESTYKHLSTPIYIFPQPPHILQTRRICRSIRTAISLFPRRVAYSSGCGGGVRGLRTEKDG